MPLDPQYGKCPGCFRPLKRVKAQPIEIELDDTTRLAPGVSYFCPDCGALLSIQLDPFAAEMRRAGASWFAQNAGAARQRPRGYGHD